MFINFINEKYYKILVKLLNTSYIKKEKKNEHWFCKALTNARMNRTQRSLVMMSRDIQKKKLNGTVDCKKPNINV